MLILVSTKDVMKARSINLSWDYAATNKKMTVRPHLFLLAFEPLIMRDTQGVVTRDDFTSLKVRISNDG